MVVFAVVAGILTLAGMASIAEGLLGRRGIRVYVVVTRQRLSVAEQAERWLETQT